ncbi:hypothetical protein ACSBR2_028782 [Camellia fascicularis]
MGGIFPSFVIHIINNLPTNSEPLRLRCQSKDTDFGMHTLVNGQEFSWKFIPNAIPTTLYFCHFYWTTKDRVFAVYDNRIDSLCDTHTFKDKNCYWSVRSDGFYFRNDKTNYKKINDWTP